MSTTSRPQISVLMPVYNCAPYLDDAIFSIRHQTFTDFEFVIVNDGSTDDSLAIINSHAAADPRITVIDRPNGGIVAALNAGLAKCKGEFIARMDGDDVSELDRFLIQLEYMRRHPEVVACGTEVKSIDQHGYELGVLGLPLDTKGIVKACLGGLSGGICHPVAFIRHQALLQAGAYRGRGYEDADLMLRLSRFGELANLDTIGLKYRRRPGQITRSYNHEQTLGALEALTNYERANNVSLRKFKSNLHVLGAWQTADLGLRDAAWRHVKQSICLSPWCIAPWRALVRFLIKGLLFTPSVPPEN